MKTATPPVLLFLMGYIGIGMILGYIGVMEKKMDATIGLGFRVLTFRWQEEDDQSTRIQGRCPSSKPCALNSNLYLEIQGWF